MATYTTELNLKKPSVDAKYSVADANGNADIIDAFAGSVASDISAIESKLDTIDTNANNYTLPTASGSVLGGVKVGENLSIDVNGVLSSTGGGGGISQGIEILTEDPSGVDLYEGRIWIYREPVYSEAVEVDTLSLPNGVNAGAAAYGAPYMVSVVYKPSSQINLSKIETSFTTRSISLHNTGNNIRLRLCTDDGTGKPNLSNVIATKTITGNPATTDTLFNAVATFATISNNFADRITLSADTKYHFVYDIPTGTGLSFNSNRVNEGGTANDAYYHATFAVDTWMVTDTFIPLMKIYKAVTQ